MFLFWIAQRLNTRELYKILNLVPRLKTFFMLNSTEHEISTAHKTKIPTNEEVSSAFSL